MLGGLKGVPRLLILGCFAVFLAVCAATGKRYLDQTKPDLNAATGHTEVKSLSTAPVRPIKGMSATEVAAYIAQYGHRPDAISVNEATEDDFCKLGMSRSLAERIIQRRNQRLGINTIEELQYVKGMGPARLERYRQFLKL